MVYNKIISSDSHVVEPPTVWKDRMDKNLWGSLIPHLRRGGPDDPFDWWFVGDQKLGTVGAVAAAGKRFEHPETILQAGVIENVRAGAFIPSEHVKDLDIDGVYGSVVYPSAALPFFGLKKTALIRVILEAYNDWLSEFCKEFPLRIKGIGAIVLDDDIDEAIESLQKASQRGLAGVMISSYPQHGERYYESKYERFWEAAEGLDMPLSLHVSTNRIGGPQILVDGKQAINATDRCNNDFYVRQSVGDIVYYGVLERFPKLKIVSVEHELGWIPFFIERMDVHYRDRPDVATYRFKDQALPSDFMRRNVFHSFQEDYLGIRLRDLIGVDQIMWGSDYPHAESTFPRSREILDEIMKDVSQEERGKIVGGNAANVYKFK